MGVLGQFSEIYSQRVPAIRITIEFLIVAHICLNSCYTKFFEIAGIFLGMKLPRWIPRITPSLLAFLARF